ncbi:ABC transporter substrate-binding protein [Streptomyces sp. GMR22]|uniref:ABC transporter substrate-binding protein n=1 Tax=Streptomyces sp. GMR22 TaxID=2759524 RepID=UPI0015FA71B9|nr:ABC transporter substrate-binding protein [Streptomyces sp. GMR22]MBA6440669.1 ABC transporter substrate-binding protein [Streptomyces sp. GMR22]
MNVTLTRRHALMGALAVAAAGTATACGSSSSAGNTDAKTINLLTSSDPKIVNNVKRVLGPEFTRRTGITVKIEQAGPAWTEVDTRLQADLTAGHRPDVALVGINSVRTYADSKLAQPMDTLMAQAKFDASQYSSSLLNVGRFDDRTMGLPYSVSTLVLYLNVEVLRKAGLNPDRAPATFSEMRTYATKIVSSKAARYGVAWAYSTDSNWALQAMLDSAGGSMMDPAEKHVTVNQRPMVRLLQYWRDLVRDGTSTVTTSADLTAAFLRGDLGMMLQSSSQSTAVAAGASFPIRIDVLPVPDGGRRRTPPGGGAAVIFARDEKVQRSAWKVVQELIGPAGQTQLVKTSGYTSVNQRALTDPRYLGNLLRKEPLRAAGVAEIKTLVPWYQFPGAHAVEAQKQLQNAVVAAMSGTEPVQRALDDAAQSISGLLVR